MIRSCSINHKFIDKHLHERRNELVENFGNDALERCWGSLQPEQHDDGHEDSIYYKGSFLLVVWVHAYLIVPVKPIQEVVHFLAYHGKGKASMIITGFHLQ